MEGNSMVLDIQRFAEGASGEGTTGTGAEVGQPQNTGENAANADTASVAGEQKDSQPIDLSSYTEEQIEELIDKTPSLKKVFGKRTDGIIGKRLAQERAKMKPANDILDKMMVLHGVKTVEELGAKLNETLPGEFATKYGVSEDMGNEMLDLRVKSMRDDRMSDYYKQQREVNRQIQEWEKEAESVKSVYSDFDLKAELENPDFRRLISNVDPRYRMPMKQIYELIHHEELVKAAEDKVAQAYAKSVNTNLMRPVENGAGSQSAVSNNSNVSKLTRKERAELAKRAQRGETITFN